MKNERNEEWSYEEWKIWRMKENKNELELVLCNDRKVETRTRPNNKWFKINDKLIKLSREGTV